MNEREKVIADFNRKIKEAEGARKRLLSDLGAFLLDRDIDSIDGFGEYALRAADTKIALEKSVSAQNEIKQILERKGAVRYRLKEVEGGLAAVEKENSQSYKAIGEAVYQAYNSGNVSGEEFQTMFTEIIRQIVELRRIEREIDDSRRAMESKAVFEKLIDQGRLAILSGNKAMKERTIEREFWKAGKQLCSTDILDSIEYQPLKDLAAACIAGRQKLRDTAELKASLVAEDESLTKTLESHDAGRYPQKRLQDLERVVHSLQESYRSTLAAIGEKYIEAKPAGIDPDQPIDSILQELEVQKRNIRSHQSEIERNKAFLRAEVLTVQIGEMTRKVSTLEQQIEKMRREIDNLKTEIDVRQTERERMERIAAGKPS